MVDLFDHLSDELGTTIKASERTKRRLDRRTRMGVDNSYDDVINRLLDATMEMVSIEEVIDAITDFYDDIAMIKADTLPSCENPSKVIITVHTGEAGSLEDHPPIFNQGNEYVKIKTDDETYVAFVRVMATFDGPGTLETSERTTLYMNDNVLGGEPVSIDEGLERLRTKLGMDHEEIREWNREREEQSNG